MDDPVRILPLELSVAADCDVEMHPWYGSRCPRHLLPMPAPAGLDEGLKQDGPAVGLSEDLRAPCSPVDIVPPAARLGPKQRATASARSQAPGRATSANSSAYLRRRSLR